MSLVSRLSNVRRKCALVLPVAVLTFAAAAALAAAAAFASLAIAASGPASGTFAAHTSSVTTTGPTTATVNGTIDPAGHPAYYKAVYDLSTSKWCSSNGTSGKPANSTPSQLLPYSDFYIHGVAVNLSGLTGGSKYCAAISATSSSGGTSAGSPIRFTSGAPAAASYSVTSTSSTTATLYGAVNPAGHTTIYQVRYDVASSAWCSSGGTSGTPAYSTGPQTLPYTDGRLHSVWVNFTGLVSGSSYCATITAANSTSTASASVVSFTLDVPGVVNSNVAVTGATSATVNGAVNASGQANTYYRAISDLANSTWCVSNGTTPDATTTYGPAMAFADTDSTFHSVSVDLTVLTAGIEYCATIAASNPSGGITQAVPIYFTTNGTGTSLPPTVATGSASGIGTGSATVSGTVNANGEAATYHFDYGTSTNYTSQTISEPISSTTAELVDAGLTGLSPNTVYHYRIEATDAWGTSYGTDQTFTTTG